MLLVSQSFFDAVLPATLWHVDEGGALLGVVQLAADDDVAGVAATPEGFVLLGERPHLGGAIARRYDASMQLLGDDPTMMELGGIAARFQAGATRDGATLLVGHCMPALPGSAAKVAVLERTRLP